MATCRHPLPSWRARNRERTHPLLAWMAHEDAYAEWTARTVAERGGLPEWYAALLLELLSRQGLAERGASEYGAYRLTGAGRRATAGR